MKKSSSEECPSHPGAGASGPQPPPLPFPPTPPGTHTIGASVHGDASWQQEKLHGDAGVRHTELWMAAAEAAGSLTRKRRTKPALFLFLVFFLNLTGAAPRVPPYMLGRGVLSGVVDFFSLKRLFLNSQWRGWGEVQWNALLDHEQAAVRVGLGAAVEQRGCSSPRVRPWGDGVYSSEWARIGCELRLESLACWLASPGVHFFPVRHRPLPVLMPCMV